MASRAFEFLQDPLEDHGGSIVTVLRVEESGGKSSVDRVQDSIPVRHDPGEGVARPFEEPEKRCRRRLFVEIPEMHGKEAVEEAEKGGDAEIRLGKMVLEYDPRACEPPGPLRDGVEHVFPPTLDGKYNQIPAGARLPPGKGSQRDCFFEGRKKSRLQSFRHCRGFQARGDRDGKPPDLRPEHQILLDRLPGSYQIEMKWGDDEAQRCPGHDGPGSSGPAGLGKRGGYQGKRKEQIRHDPRPDLGGAFHRKPGDIPHPRELQMPQLHHPHVAFGDGVVMPVDVEVSESKKIETCEDDPDDSGFGCKSLLEME